MERMFSFIAVLKSRDIIAINPRVSPHPGQDTPKTFCIGHSEKEKNFVMMNNPKNKRNPAIKECKASFVLLGVFLYLRQRLTITVSEST